MRKHQVPSANRLFNLFNHLNYTVMKLKITALLLAVFGIMLTLMQTNCNPKTEDDKTLPTEEKADKVVKPVALPTNIVPGFNFPEDSASIYKWISNNSFSGSYDSASVYKHAWGIWAGLTANSGEKYAGDEMLVYETWLGLNDVRNLVETGQNGCDGVARKNGRASLQRPKQFEHAARFEKQNLSLMAVKGMRPFQNPSTVWVTVSYNPDAACYATQNKIFKQSVINKYYQAGGAGAITPFPSKSMTVKPTYMVYDNNDSLFRLPVWITAPVPANAGFTGQANNFVFIDKNNKQPKGKTAVPVDSTETNEAKIKAATINLSDFISFKLDKKMADFMNQQDSVQGMNNNAGSGYGTAKAGEVAVLVGMHVTTKEISNWTWQSYYWTPNRSHPGAPSSDLAASLRPTEITGAAANYACVAAYVMLTPNNPPNKTAGAGPMFGYNPYLEGAFGPGVFAGFANTYNASYQYGTQSNCMSCHALAVASPAGVYTTDQTIDLKGTYFNKQVSVDFAWSIQTALINDTIPYWQFTAATKENAVKK